MANFKEAYEITMGHEGGYSNDPVDAGGETYKGITKRFEPDWEGWVIIDSLRNDPNFPKCLDENEELQEKVMEVYKRKYWDIFWGDKFDNQDIANEMFDTGVNMGTTRAIKYLQKSLNLLNRDQKNYSDISEDGVIGNNTLNTLNNFLNKFKRDVKYLLKLMNLFQGMHYINYMGKDSKQERFARGWLNRVKI
jgi:lysozyme family protein